MKIEIDELTLKSGKVLKGVQYYSGIDLIIHETKNVFKKLFPKKKKNNLTNNS